MRTAMRLVSLVTLASCAAMSCSDGGTSPTPTPSQDGGVCTPDRAQWNSTVRGLVAQQCGGCHGDTPSYGASYSLLDYDALLRPRTGGRPVDRIAARMMAGTMPPAGTPAPTDDVARAIVQWATCGAQTPPAGHGLRATRPVFRSPPTAPSGMETWDLTAPQWSVGPDVLDRYQCFTFEFPGTTDRFVRRFELVADQRAVLHHVVLLRDNNRVAPTTPFECGSMPEGSDYLYAWAPGQDALQFPEGGLRITPGQRLVMQIHYNNGQHLPNVRDSSGLRLYHTAPSGTEYGMVALGPLAFQIPARSTGQTASACTVTRESRMLAGMPHMHQFGSTFTEEIVRSDNSRESLIGIQGWQFESQLFYDFSTPLHPGDRIETQCVFTNTTPSTVRSGGRTSDEMCFNFAYITPPPSERYCDQPVGSPEMVPYTPGMCAIPAAPTDLATVSGRAMVAAAPALAGGTLRDGRWELQGVTWYLNSGMVGTSTTINLDETSLHARGQVWINGTQINADLVTRLNLTLVGGARLSRDLPTTFAGALASGTTSPLRLTASCPSSGAPQTLDYAVDGDTLTVGPPAQNYSGLMVTPRYQFRFVR